MDSVGQEFGPKQRQIDSDLPHNIQFSLGSCSCVQTERVALLSEFEFCWADAFSFSFSFSLLSISAFPFPLLSRQLVVVVVLLLEPLACQKLEHDFVCCSFVDTKQQAKFFAQLTQQLIAIQFCFLLLSSKFNLLYCYCFSFSLCP